MGQIQFVPKARSISTDLPVLKLRSNFDQKANVRKYDPTWKEASDRMLIDCEQSLADHSIGARTLVCTVYMLFIYTYATASI